MPASRVKRAAKKPKRAKRAKKKRTNIATGPRLLRTSERSTWKKCRWAWDLDYNQRLKPREETPALRFGTLIHAALELRYPPGIKRGPHPARSFEKIYADDLKYKGENWRNFDAEAEEWVDAQELGVEMLEGYIDTYGRDEEWKVIASEMTFKVPVFLPSDYDSKLLKILSLPETVWDHREPLFYYVGTMDGVWENRMSKGIMINDYKTSSKDLKKEAEGKETLDAQGTAYWTWGADFLINEGILKPQAAGRLEGMLYTFLKKSKQDARAVNDLGQSLNKDGSVSKTQPAPRHLRHVVYRGEDEREKARHSVIDEVLEIMAVEKGILAPYKNSETGNNGHCTWCSYRDVCELHESGGDWEHMRDAVLVPWDPYASHEIKRGDQER